MSKLPTEIWEMIISFVHPISLGWHRGLWQIALVSKTFNEMMAYFWIKYMKKPIFPIELSISYLTKKDIIHCMTLNSPVIEPGFLYHSECYSRRISESKILLFSSTNIYNNTNVNDNMNYFQERYLISKSFINCEKSKDDDQPKTIVNVEIPIIIVPFWADNGFDTFIDGVFAVGDFDSKIRYIFLEGPNQGYQRGSYTQPISHSYEIDDLVLKILMYLKNPNNKIPYEISKLIELAEKYYNDL